MQCIDGFYNGYQPNVNTDYVPGDNYEMFVKNCEKMPEDWYYRNVTINYSYNRLGFRFKQPENIDLDNYILYTGCSHTEGIGLELERSFPYLISKHFNMDYVNLAVSGTGIDILECNLLTWLHKFEKKPRLVVIQYPDHSRFIAKYPGYDHLIESGSWQDNEHEKRFIVLAEESGLFNARKFLINSNIKNTIDVPFVTINFSSLALYDSSALTLRRIDRARDLSHAGVLSHAEITKIVIDRIMIQNLL
jgi:hypothetical protein